MIRAIYACDIDGGIGKNGTIPWPRNDADLQWFKKCTEGGIVVMGRNTWEDPMLPKPLPNRYNVVVSDRKLEDFDTRPNIVISRDSVERYIKGFEELEQDVWIIGGAKLLNSSWDFIEEVWISKIEEHWHCDTHVHVPRDWELFEVFDNFDTGLSYEKLRNPKRIYDV